MKTILFIAITLVAILSASAQFGTGQRTAFQFTHSGQNRTFNVYHPTIYTGTEPVPMVLCLHPGGPYSTTMNLDMENYSHFDLVSDTANFILVYPNGTDQVYGTWEDNYQYGVDDIGFLQRVIDTVKAHYNIDNDCLFMTGFSRGGFMTYTMACTNSSLFKAIAPVSGQMQHSFNCTPSLKVPIFHIHGDNDNDAIYQGDIPGNDLESVPTTLNLWAVNNDCNPSPVESAIPNTSSSDLCDITRLYYTPNPEGKEIIHYRVNNGGHFWPGSTISHVAEGFSGRKNMDIDASVEIWRFFRKYCANSTSGFAEKLDMESELTVYPNPSTDKILLDKSESEGMNIEVYDLSGKIIYEFIMTDSHSEIIITNWLRGSYIVKGISKNRTSIARIVKI